MAAQVNDTCNSFWKKHLNFFFKFRDYIKKERNEWHKMKNYFNLLKLPNVKVTAL